VTAPPQDAQIAAVPFAPAALYAVLPEDHPAAYKESLLHADPGLKIVSDARRELNDLLKPHRKLSKTN